jgi:hypothetical protein
LSVDIASPTDRIRSPLRGTGGREETAILPDLYKAHGRTLLRRHGRKAWYLRDDGRTCGRDLVEMHGKWGGAQKASVVLAKSYCGWPCHVSQGAPSFFSVGGMSLLMVAQVDPYKFLVEAVACAWKWRMSQYNSQITTSTGLGWVQSGPFLGQVSPAFLGNQCRPRFCRSCCRFGNSNYVVLDVGKRTRSDRFRSK